MNKFSVWVVSFLLVAVVPGRLQAQQKSMYDPKQLFDPLFFTHNGNEYRSADGAPGPRYWQNSASYLIHATLDEADTLIKGDVTIHYTNQSPDTLRYVWLQLDQNLFSPSSRGAATTLITGDRFDVKGYKKGGYDIISVRVTYLGKSYRIDPVITDTRMQLRLPFSLKPHGAKLDIKVNYSFSIPEYGADRMGRLFAEKGVVYQLAQWYPRMCVYDDVRGWNTLPYMGLGEFYCEYGDFDYYITAPADMVVVGSGDLQNPSEVLTKTQIERLNKARQSDSTIHIIDETEVGTAATRPKQSGDLTWHFKMKNSRDVSWAASKGFLWDAARIRFPSGRKGIAMAAYPLESKGDMAYGRATQYLKQSIEFYSGTYFEFPWNSATVVGGVALGMEYPGIIFCSYKIVDGDLWHDVTHEIGHNWFPMIVGSDERRYMWMDEGLNTFINGYASNWFNHGEYGDTAQHAMLSSTRPTRKSRFPLMTPPEAMGLNDYGQYYFKTAEGLNLLREVVLGPDRFDFAFKTYIRRWAFKHPQPDDFFRTMDDAAGDDLGWFWKQWFYTTWQLDQAVEGVKYVHDDPAQGALISIENLGQMAFPAIVKMTEKNGHSSLVKLPVEIWQRGENWTFKYNSTSAITSVVLDPDGLLPDSDRSNNSWKPAP